MAGAPNVEDACPKPEKVDAGLVGAEVVPKPPKDDVCGAEEPNAGCVAPNPDVDGAAPKPDVVGAVVPNPDVAGAVVPNPDVAGVVVPKPDVEGAVVPNDGAADVEPNDGADAGAAPKAGV